jgi:CheY-like chemotaxis protein
MTATEVMQFVVSITQALAWPVVLVAIVILMRRELKRFLNNIGQFQVKAGGIEATISQKDQLQAAAWAGAAITKSSEAGGTEQTPISIETNVREIATALSQAAAVPKSIAGSRILWVDDRPQNNVYERKSLEALGIQFVLSESTEDALEKVRTQKVDLIISDMGRPPDSRAGYTLLNELRKRGFTTPYVIYAGSNLPEHQAEAVRNGALGSTNRPQDLFKMVIRALSPN